MFWRCPLTSIMCIHSSIHWHLLWVLYRISIAFQCFFLRTSHGLSMICHGCSVYFAWLFCWVTMCGFTDPFNPFPMSNDSSLFYSLLYRDLYNISHAFHSIDINTRFTLLFLSLFSLLLNSFPSHFSTRDILILFNKQWWCARAVYRYTNIILKCWSYKCTSAKGTSVFPNSIFIQANNIIWHVFHARHFYNVKLVKNYLYQSAEGISEQTLEFVPGMHS